MYDTIAAIATARGEGAIGIVRLSGDNALNVLNKIATLKSGLSVLNMKARKLYYGHIVDGEKKVDEILVAYMKGPKTYTCEDVIEINCHGGVVPLTEILKLVLKHGARMAEPGEFTQRAFLNGRLDLAQAESVMDLISAKTQTGFDIAIEQLGGSLSSKVDSIRQHILTVMSKIEVNIDYPDEDIEEVTYKEIESEFEIVEEDIYQLLLSSESGRIIREGLNTVIIGKPNVGKSSLMNALLRESRAIVTDIPGTTRDVIEEYINIKGIPVKIMDTAGIRETEDIVEKMGVEKSKELFNNADLVIIVLNSAEALSEEDKHILDVIHDKKVVVIVNKIDLPQKIDEAELYEILPNIRVIKTSITNETGLDELEDAIATMVYGGQITQKNQAVVTNVRHITSLENSLKSIKEAMKAVRGGLPLDFIEVDVKNTYDYLGEIIGETVEDDLVKKIFSSFCLGK